MGMRRLVLAFGFALGVASMAVAGRPNVVWIVADDMSPNFGCYGETVVATPHVDRLAREGTRFAHAYVTAPVCSPSRSALITGMEQTAIGAEHHRSGRGELTIHLPKDVRPIPELFREAGYYTCIGSGERRGKGTDRKGQAAKGGGKTDYNFEWDAGMYDGADWSGRRPGQPFFMQVMLSGGKLRDGQRGVEQITSRADAELGGRTALAAVTMPPHLPDDAVLVADRAAYLDAVRFTDAEVGRVLARLEREGLLDTTVVTFMTDHGISHARGKQFLYDEGTHVPLIVRGPGIPAGAVREDLVEHIDLAALSLGAAGIQVPSWMRACDLFAEGYVARDAVFAARDRCDETVDRIRSVRTDEYLYIRNFHPRRPHLQPNAYKDGKLIVKRLRELHEARSLPEVTERLLFAPERPEEELYAWRDDPWQLTNLAADPAHADELVALRERLARWMAETGDDDPESEAMYDSDMRVHVDQGNRIKEENIATMKRWAAEGR
jgi:arylsulfatase A-like enzyme